MIKMITLTHPISEPESELGEDDQPVLTGGETLQHTIVNPHLVIRSFSARKGNRVGTRIVYTSGRALPVLETVDAVTRMLKDLYADTPAADGPVSGLLA